MPKRALVQHRPWLLASILAATLFYFLRDEAIGGIQLMILKAAGVALLAVYALHRGRCTDARLMGLVMALSALGDALIEISFITGGAAFLLSHLAAITLYLRNRRAHPTSSQKLTGIALLLATPLVSWLLSSGDWGVTLYSLGLGAMACFAWLSRFPRYRVGMGAVLFVLSDWLIFSQVGFIGENPVAQWLIWPLYYGGQFMIATGVVQTLRHEKVVA